MMRWLLALAVVCFTLAPGQPQRASVAVLRSVPTLKNAGWVGQWELDTCVKVLRELGTDPVVVDPAELQDGTFDALVLCNTRCMAPKEVAAVRAYHDRGGRILATYLASYRNQDNQAVGEGNHFQLADLFGCDVYAWASGGGACARLGNIELARNTAMLVSPAPGARVLDRWTNADRRPPAADAAVVQSPDGRVIYVGEDLFVADDSQSGEVKRYLGGLLDRLGLSRDPEPVAYQTEMVTEVPYPPDAPVPAASGPPMRVGLEEEPSLVVWSPQGLDVDGSPAPAVEVKPDELKADQKVRLSSSGYLIAVARHENGTGRIRGYRGTLVLSHAADGRLGVVNELPLEQYVAGVVPNEMGPLYPPQALAAMSVVARTFALSHRHRHEADGYDVCATVHCQVYGAMLSEWPTSNAAVAATEGQVAYFGDAPADTTFHAVCGGVGEAVQNVWNEPAQPYLVRDSDGPAPVPDLSDETALRQFIDHPPQSWCQQAGRFRWTATYTWDELTALFHQSLKQDVGPVQALRVLERVSSGRVLTLEIQGRDGTVEVHKDAIRWLWSGGTVGTGGLQSTLFYIETLPTGVRLHGGGWGHGVGMCQDGARGMARAGYDYQAILQHYYPGVVLRGD